jgi:hypothetical protein
MTGRLEIAPYVNDDGQIIARSHGTIIVESIWRRTGSRGLGAQTREIRYVCSVVSRRLAVQKDCTQKRSSEDAPAHWAPVFDPTQEPKLIQWANGRRQRSLIPTIASAFPTLTFWTPVRLHQDPSAYRGVEKMAYR